MKQRWEHSPWAPEIRLLNRWARWCINGNQGEIMRLCGLTWGASPKSVMARLWECGAVEESDVTGYAPELPPPADTDSQLVDAFMSVLGPILPTAHAALVARHRRMVRGESFLIRSESWIAKALYGMRSGSGSWRRLNIDCEAGYRALRRWLDTTKSGNSVL